MSINTLNEKLFKQNRSYYVFVEEDKIGMLCFVTNPSYSLNNDLEVKPSFEYDTTYNIEQAYPVMSGDPIIAVARKHMPHLSLYRVQPTYKYKYVDIWEDLS